MSARPVAGRRPELLAVERRALEEVGELRAVALVVERELLVPRADVSSSVARTRPPPPRRAARRKPIGCSRSSARCASRLAVRARIGTALTAVGGEAEVEQHRGDRHRDVHRQRLARPRRPRRGTRAQRRRARRSRRARRRARGSARRAGRPACAPDGRSPAPCRRAARISRATSAGARRRRPREQPRALLRRAEHDRAGAEDPGRDRALERVRVGRERHPRGDVRRHQPVLGDRDEQQVEEEALVLGRLVAGEQQVEVLGEA